MHMGSSLISKWLWFPITSWPIFFRQMRFLEFVEYVWNEFCLNCGDEFGHAFGDCWFFEDFLCLNVSHWCKYRSWENNFKKHISIFLIKKVCKLKGVLEYVVSNLVTFFWKIAWIFSKASYVWYPAKILASLSHFYANTFWCELYEVGGSSAPFKFKYLTAWKVFA